MRKGLFKKENIKAKVWLFGLAVGLFVFDFVSKLLVLRFIPIGQSVPVLPPVLYFTHIKNRGIAFGGLNNGGAPTIINTVVIGVVVAVAIVFLVYLILSVPREQKITLLGLSMVLGGAMGNFVDRVIYREVTDFINIGITTTPVGTGLFSGGIRFPWIFNLADTWITVGIVLFIIALVFLKEERKGEHADNEDAVPASDEPPVE